MDTNKGRSAKLSDQFVFSRVHSWLEFARLNCNLFDAEFAGSSRPGFLMPTYEYSCQKCGQNFEAFQSMRDEPFRELDEIEFARRVQVWLPGFSAWLVSREDLILSKLAWAREGESELQMRDVRNLLSGECDLAYLRQWAPALHVTEILEGRLRERHEP